MSPPSPLDRSEPRAESQFETDSASKAALHSASETLRMEVAGFGIDVMLVAPGAITSQFGKKQTLSIKLPEGAHDKTCSLSLNLRFTSCALTPSLKTTDSLYKDVADRIAERSNMSQRAGTHTLGSRSGRKLYKY